MVKDESSASSISHKGKSVDLKLSNDFAFFGRQAFRVEGGTTLNGEAFGTSLSRNASSAADSVALVAGDWRCSWGAIALVAEA